MNEKKEYIAPEMIITKIMGDILTGSNDTEEDPFE